jgi:hypothetical protein
LTESPYTHSNTPVSTQIIMFGLLPITSLVLAAASSVSGMAIVRRTTPSGYAEGYLENYSVYHTRYLALGCQNQHNTAFFKQCCHPLLATESLSSRPAECTPSASASSSASNVEPTSDVSTPADNGDDGDDGDCDGDDGDNSGASDDDGDDSSSTSDAPPPATSTSTADPADPTSNPTNNAGPAAAPAADPTTDAAPTTPAATTTTQAAASPTAPSDSSEVTGGFATFCYQNGVAGACGTVHPDSALIAAIDADRYGDTSQVSPLCGQQVLITNPANGKSVTVTIADACPTCDNSNSIDLSTGAFDQIADESQGIVPIVWNFVN